MLVSVLWMPRMRRMLICLHQPDAPPAPRNAATLFNAMSAKRCTRFAAGEWLVSSELGARDDRLLLAELGRSMASTI